MRNIQIIPKKADRQFVAIIQDPTVRWVLLDVRNNEVAQAVYPHRDLNLVVKPLNDNSGYLVETMPKDYRIVYEGKVDFSKHVEMVASCKMFDDGIVWEHTL